MLKNFGSKSANTVVLDLEGDWIHYQRTLLVLQLQRYNIFQTSS